MWIDVEPAKTFLRVDGDDENAIIGMLIDAAQSQIESITGLSIDQRQVTLYFDSWDQLSRLTVGPVISVDQITYLDTTGASRTLPPIYYRTLIRGLSTSIVTRDCIFRLLPGPGTITVTATIGYGDQLPGAIRQALLLALGDAYAFRENTIADRSVTPTELPNGIASLLTNFRVL